jgi:hypothetical protein
LNEFSFSCSLFVVIVTGWADHDADSVCDFEYINALLSKIASASFRSGTDKYTYAAGSRNAATFKKENEMKGFKINLISVVNDNVCLGLLKVFRCGDYFFFTISL